MVALRHRALPVVRESRTQSELAERVRPSEPVGPVHALFQQRVSGDDALLRLARLRFAQMGVSAELYADTPGQLEGVLRFAPAQPRLPVVHLNRGISLLQEQGQAVVRDFAGRFAGRITGLVVHDRRAMGELAGEWLAAMRELDAFLGREAPDVTLFVEYAAGLEPGRFTEMAERLQDAAHVSVCIDVGHVGIRQACARFAERHPGLAMGDLGATDARLPGLVADVQDAVGAAVGDVCEVIRSVGRLGKPVHFHLHDGHPLVPGLADHFSFLTRLPIPFSYQGRRSLSTLYGPGGLADIMSTAIRACRPRGVSFTIEVHQAEGRLPLGDAAPLFSHWKDTTNAERMNYWLNVLSENAMLISRSLADLSELIRARLPAE
jgi:sugar phosphate isomerase/epimerase